MAAPMDDRMVGFPTALRRVTRFERLAASTTPFSDGGPPALLAHPDPALASGEGAIAPAPVALWLHGRTVTKELDPGRYLRWTKLGIATCALDLPDHGERGAGVDFERVSTLAMAAQIAEELPRVIEDLAHERFRGAFDTSRIALGGMSAGGMCALAAMTADAPPASVRCVVCEAATGDFAALPRRGPDDEDLAARLDPLTRTERWPRGVPLLAVHSTHDEMVPVAGMRRFVARLREVLAARGEDPDLATLREWPETGAPREHVGFGRVTNDVKNLENTLLVEHLAPGA